MNPQSNAPDSVHLATLETLASPGPVNVEAETTLTSRSAPSSSYTETVRTDSDDRIPGGVNTTGNTRGGSECVGPQASPAVATPMTDGGHPSETSRALELRGKVTTGLGRGADFVALPGYAQQFERRLGYRPFPGTFNLELTEASRDARSRLSDLDGIHIDAWETGDRSYGAVTCYPVSLQVPDGTTVDAAHALVPDRTDHDPSQLEIIAPVELRDRLDVDDNEVISVHVCG